MNSHQILAEEIQRHDAGDGHGTRVFDRLAGGFADRQIENTRDRFQNQADDVLAGRNAADGPGQHVIEQQRRDGRLCEKSAQRLFHYSVHTAADK